MSNEYTVNFWKKHLSGFKIASKIESFSHFHRTPMRERNRKKCKTLSACEYFQKTLKNQPDQLQCSGFHQNTVCNLHYILVFPENGKYTHTHTQKSRIWKFDVKIFLCIFGIIETCYRNIDSNKIFSYVVLGTSLENLLKKTARSFDPGHQL
jgi:hypothetical protein